MPQFVHLYVINLRSFHVCLLFTIIRAIGKDQALVWGEALFFGKGSGG